MQVSPLARQGVRGRFTRYLAGAALIALAACSGESLNEPEDPQLPGDPPVSPAVQAAAWRFDVSTKDRKVKITPPAGKVSSVAAQLSRAGVEYSLVGADVISLTASNYVATGVGAGGAPAGKVRVTFDLAVTNLLSSVDLITPTFPTPPAGATGVFAFAFSTNVTTTSGGVSTSGNDVIIDLPNTGQVAPSSNFDGAPHNWFNDTGCPAGANDCYRYENYAGSIAAGATTAGQQIGFDIDPTVSNFSAKIIVAADLQNAGPAITRTVSGTVTSPQLGNLSGGSVTISGGFSATPASGNYSISGVGAGPRTVSYAPPAGCSAPTPQSITITSASPDPIPVNFVVTCNVPTGSVTGQINFDAASASTPSLTGVTVTATPSASGTSPSTGNPAAGGAYTVGGVAIGLGAGAGAGTVSFANLPSGCTFVGPNTGSYSGLTAGGSVAASAVTITCPAANYPLNYTWSAPSGGSITLTVSINMNAQNNANNNGTSPDVIGAFQGTISYGTRVSAPSCSGQSGFTGVFNTSGNSITAVITNLAGVGGNVTVYTCTFTYSATGTTTLSGTGHILGDNTGADDFTSRTTITYSPIP